MTTHERNNERKMYLAFCNLVHWTRKNIATATCDELRTKRTIAAKLCDYAHSMPGQNNRNRFRAAQAIRKQLSAQIAVNSL
tara:strand:+ start:95 stop:337 length:243 start_codon:yes stop_codon:yes gene_type:complete